MTEPNDTSDAAADSQPTAPPHDPVLQALLEAQAGQVDTALPVLEQALVQNPDHVPVLMVLGTVYGQRGEIERARDCFVHAIEIDPKLAPAHSNLGNVCKLLGDFVGAAAAYRKAIVLQPGFADAHYNLGTVLLETGEWEEAQKAFERALLFKPDYAEVHNNLGDLLMRQSKCEAALSHFRQALVWNPNLLPAQNNLVLALYRLGLYQEGEAFAERFLHERPDDRSILINQAQGLVAQGKFDQAEVIYRRLVELDGHYPGPWINLGNLLQLRQHYEASIDCYRHAMSLEGADQALCLSGIASTLLAQGQPGRAAAELKHAAMLDSRHAGVVANLGRALLAVGEVALAIETVRRAISMAPAIPELHSNLLYALHFDHKLSPAERFAAARDWNQRFGHPSDAPERPPLRQLGQGDRLRVGMVSGDFRHHSVASCLEPVLAALDHERIELTLYYVANEEDEVTRRFRGYADLWRPVAPLSAGDLANRIRNDGIDILIDLSWHTAGNRLSMFARRPAPVQVSWLGFFASTGLDVIDYRLTDGVMDPIDGPSADWHSERLLRLPVAMAYRPDPEMPEVAPLPMASRGHPTFASITRINRTNRLVLEYWSKLLHAVPDAHLIVFSGLNADDELSLERLRRLLLVHNIDEERFEIRPKLALADYLTALTSEVDMVLDSFPYCGGVSTAQALWLGVPTLTMAGPSAFERTGASLLSMAGLERFIAASPEDFVSKGQVLCRDVAGLTKLRHSLRQTLAATPLFDGAQLARAFEQLMADAWNGVALDHA
ncbi:tetratricopeptide repeat protein [Chitinimonas lacunae]|uniref:protein O-GlcNAc transferase n=1 Tax=Chitinimonas lacunae TaxID=1963018 RepID=A0ABV8MXC9_9NEIS